jgi:hypothetical protein
MLDADVEQASENLPRRLREAAHGGGADMIVGTVDRPRPRSSVTPSLYTPLVTTLFPEVPPVPRPLSGFRAFRAHLDTGTLPGGYGVEAHLNVHVAVSGGRIETCRLGPQVGPLRGYANVPAIGADVAAAVLDLAEAHGRIGSRERPRWDAWVADVLAVMRDQPAEDADDSGYLRQLAAVAARPLPRP